MRKRYQLYIKKMPDFRKEGVPEAFARLPPAFDRQGFVKAAQIEEIDDPILVAQSEMQEEIEAIQATLQKHRVDCLFVDAGSSLKRAMEPVRIFYSSRIRPIVQAISVSGGMIGSVIAVVLIGGGAAALWGFLTGGRFDASGCGGDGTSALLRPGDGGSGDYEQRVSLFDLLNQAAARGSGDTAEQDYSRLPLLSGMFAELLAGRETPQPDEPVRQAPVQRYVPGTGPFARFIVELRQRGMERLAPHSLSQQGGAGTPSAVPGQSRLGQFVSGLDRPVSHVPGTGPYARFMADVIAAEYPSFDPTGLPPELIPTTRIGLFNSRLVPPRRPTPEPQAPSPGSGTSLEPSPMPGSGEAQAPGSGAPTSP